jgi:Tol biopolymer transport system component
MNKTLFFIQTLIIIVLLVICTTIAIQLREYQKAYGLRSNKPVVGMNVSPEATTSASPYPTLAEDQVPDFSKVTNSASNPPEVEAVLGDIAAKKTTGYRVSRDYKTVVYVNDEHLAEVDVATKKETELVSFLNWPKEAASDTNVCAPGSRFAKPIYNGDEKAIFFVGPNHAKDAVYIFTKGSKEAKLVTQADDCVTDIAVSPTGVWIAYQTSKTISTLTEGYVTDLYVVQADGMHSQVTAKEGVVPKESLSEGTQVDFAPAEIVWPNENVFYIKGFFLGKPTGVWKYDVAKNSFKLATNLKGGP